MKVEICDVNFFDFFEILTYGDGQLRMEKVRDEREMTGTDEDGRETDRDGRGIDRDGRKRLGTE